MQPLCRVTGIITLALSATTLSAWGAPSVTASAPTATSFTINTLTVALPEVAKKNGFSEELAAWYIQDGIVHVGVTKASNTTDAALRQTFGPSVKIFASDRPRQTSRVVEVKRYRKVSMGRRAAGPDSPPSQTFPNRRLDGVPYSGGDQIAWLVKTSSGYAVHQCTANTQVVGQGVLTAGHCGPLGTIYDQGYIEPSDNTFYSTGTYGRAVKTVYGTGGDAQLLKGAANGYQPVTYTSTAWLWPSLFVSDYGSANANVGTAICTDGSFSDRVCGGTVAAVNVCVHYSDPGAPASTCHLSRATASVSLAQHGDSGGPVFGPSPSGKGVTVGIISGSDPTGKTLYFSDIAAANTALGTTQVKR